MEERLNHENVEVIKRCEELKDLLNRGEITELNILPSFPVQDAFTKNGVDYPTLCYIPCFSYADKQGRKFVEDSVAKSEDRRILRTLFEYTYMNLSVKDIL